MRNVVFRLCSVAAFIFGSICFLPHTLAVDTINLPIENKSDCFFPYLLSSQNQKKPLPKHITWTGNCEDGLWSGDGELVMHRGDFVYTISYQTLSNNGQIMIKVTGIVARPSSDQKVTFEIHMDQDHEIERTVLDWPGHLKFDGVADTLNFEGSGVVIYQDGDRYEGDVLDLRPNGRGVKRSVDGTIYKGNFVDGRFTGKGVKTYDDGARSEGEFVNGFLNGKGRSTFPDGALFEGEFKDGILNGNGVIELPKQVRLEGRFVDGYLTGPGVMILPDGVTCEGQWQGGRLVGIGEGLKDGEETRCVMDPDGTLILEPLK